ncbi:hypothetical protein N0V82_008722 [Gnomoniopsis sp. IMI 355080]|nr:hypothetical protein N0V82_008722 [Gnomoniopsis sp. IMI 355080]
MLDRSPSPADSAVWSEEGWEDTPRLPHKREQRILEEKRRLELQLETQDSQLEACREQAEANEAIISTLQHHVGKLGAKNDQLSQDCQKSKQEHELRVTELEASIDVLKSQLELAKNHASLLQGACRDAIPPNAIADTFKELIDSVSSWVLKHVDRFEDDPTDREATLKYSANNHASTARLRRIIGTDSDFRRSSAIMGSDEDIITSIIWSLLMENVFYREGPYYTDEYVTRLRVISELEQEMSSACKSPQDLYAISAWKARAIDAVVKDPAVSATRSSFTAWLAENLANLLLIFSPTTDEESFAHSIRTNILEPAVELHELMLGERSKYFLNFDNLKSSRYDRSSANTAFFRSLDSLDCIILKPGLRKRLDPATQLAGAGIKETYHRLTKLCVVSPALITRHISDQDGFGPAEVLAKQTVIVLFDSANDHHRPGRTFLHELTFPSAVGKPEDA